MSITYKQNDNRIFYIVYTDKGKSSPFKIQQDVPSVTPSGEAVYDEVNKSLKLVSSEIKVPFIPGVNREWSVPLDSTGKFATGLNIEVANPYYQLPHYRSQQFREVLQGNPMAKLQHVLEYEDNVDFNAYTDRFPTKDREGHDMFESVFKSKKVGLKLNNSVIALRMNNPMERLAYYALNHRADDIEPVVARNLKEFDNPLIKESCKFVFLDENDKAEDILESKKDSREIGYLSVLIEEGIKDNLALQLMKALELPDSRNLTYEKNPLQSTNILISLIEQNPDIRKRTRELLNMYNDSVRRVEFNALVLIGEGLIYDKIHKTNDNYTVYLVIEGEASSQTFTDKNLMVKNLFLNPAMKNVIKDFSAQIQNMKSKDIA